MICWFIACNAPELSPQKSEDTAAQNAALAVAGSGLTGWINEPVVFDGSGSSGDSFEWYFGDGSSSTGLVSTHTFSEPGTYQAVLTAFGGNGINDTDAIAVSIQYPPTESQPTVSSSIAADDEHIWAVFPENGSVTQLAIDGTLIEEWFICNSPQNLSLSEGIIGVSCRQPATMVLIDPNAEETQSIPLPENSQPLGVVGRAGTWWVTLSATGQMAKWDGESITTQVIGTDPRSLTLLADGSLMSAQWRARDNEVNLYHVQDEDVSSITLGIDTNGDSDNTTGGVPNLLEQVVPSPDGRTLFIPMLHANVLRGTYRSGSPLTFESTLRGMLANIEMNEGVEHPEKRKHFDERGRSSAVVFSPNGEKLYVLHPSAGHVSLLDRHDQEILGSILNVGVGSLGMALSPDGSTLYVHAWLDRKVRAYNVMSVDSALLWEGLLSSDEPLEEEILLGKRIFHSAADTRITRSQYIACTHCHPDGTHDGQTWDFTDRGEGLRNTTSLMGRGAMAMGPLHWTGNFDEFQDFESDMRFHFGGSGYLDDDTFAECEQSLGPPKAGLSEDLDALAIYLESLPLPSKSPDSSDSANSEVFEQLGCDECHPAPLFTDSDLNTFTRHNVGTLGDGSGHRMGELLDGLDTPTLIGLWNSAPYLHDGSARTITEAIREHDAYTDITEEEMMILINFLNSQ